jgi:DNA-binding MurR/RpiR family transcriptional regulator
MPPSRCCRTPAGPFTCTADASRICWPCTDVVVLFDYHRYQRSAADLALRVHRAGATVLLITDDLACPVAPDAEVVLAASSTVGTTFQSMAAGFLLTELLIPLVMDALGEPARTRMALWEEQRRTGLLP